MNKAKLTKICGSIYNPLIGSQTLPNISIKCLPISFKTEKSFTLICFSQTKHHLQISFDEETEQYSFHILLFIQKNLEKNA